MKAAIKTDSMNSVKFVEHNTRNYAEFVEDIEDAFLDAPHSKSFTVPQGEYNRPTVQTVKTEGRGVPILEGLIFCFFSFCIGFWLGVSHTNGVLKNSQPHVQADQAAGYAVFVLLPLFWLAGLFLYYRKRRLIK